MSNFCKIGFVEMFAGFSAPMGFVICNGQALDKVKYANLYSVIGDVYTPTSHSDSSTFCVPDFSGRSPLGACINYPLGVFGGEDKVTLSENEIPNHTHLLNASSSMGTSNDPSNRIFANTGAFDNEYASGSGDVQLSDSVVSSAGGGQAHNNMHPYLSINFVIYTGI